MRIRLATLLVGMLLGAPLALAGTTDRPPAASRPNVLLVVADDLGVDRVACYREHPDPGHTPVIDSLAAKGLLFRHAWSEPLCSPTRATLMTGQYSFRTGLGTIINYGKDTAELPRSLPMLPRLLRPVYSTAAAGKWHLSAAHGTGTHHPQLCGFEHFRGSMQAFPGVVSNAYSNWDRTVDGKTAHCTTYATTSTVNDAIELLGAMPEPWFLYVAFNAPHTPYHKPPANLHSFELPESVADNIPIHMKAMTEAMDTEFGRLLASLSPEERARTVIIFVGDNGTDPKATTPPFFVPHAKGTIFEGGVRVPLIVSGPGVVAGAESAALVNTTDLFATILQLAGQPGAAKDSVSIVPYLSHPELPSIRSWIYADIFKPNGPGPKTDWRRTTRDARFKLVTARGVDGNAVTFEALFDLEQDPFERLNLLNDGELGDDAEASLVSLRSVLDQLQPGTR